MGAITEGGLLDGKVRLRQPETGFRVAIDSVFLAAFVAARPGERVLDAGCGVGAAALCLAVRLPEVRVDGLELQAALAALAVENAALNGMTGRVTITTGDLADPVAEGGYHHVMSNPPYHAGGTPPGDPGRAAAHMEGGLDLEGWLRACLKRLRPRGRLALVHRADRLDGLLAALHGRVGDIEVLPLWPKPGRPAGRVLVRGRQGAAGPLTLLPGLVLHEDDGSFTPAAQAVLRGGAGL